MKTLKALVIAPHPDDAEIFMGGTIAYLKDKQCSVTILDLTKGELSTRGTLATRGQETAKASSILSIDKRICADLPDGGIQANPKQVAALVTIIREEKPDILFAPYTEGRHPDHHNTHLLTKDAIFMANLGKYTDNKTQVPHLTSSVYWYMARSEFKPSILVDITAFRALKMQAIEAYQGQVKPGSSNEPKTLVSSELSLHSIEARDAYYGSMGGVKYAEPFFHSGPIMVSEHSIFNTSQDSNSRFIYPTS